MEKTKKYDLIDRINKSTDIDKKTIGIVVDSLFEELKVSLSNKSVIELRGFGTFEPRERKGKKNARNPRTGSMVDAKNHFIAVFRPGKELKDLMLKIPTDSTE